MRSTCPLEGAQRTRTHLKPQLVCKITLWYILSLTSIFHILPKTLLVMSQTALTLPASFHHHLRFYVEGPTKYWLGT